MVGVLANELDTSRRHQERAGAHHDRIRDSGVHAQEADHDQARPVEANAEHHQGAEHHRKPDRDAELGPGQTQRLAGRRPLSDIDSTINAEAPSSAVPIPICTCRLENPADEACSQERAQDRRPDNARPAS